MTASAEATAPTKDWSVELEERLQRLQDEALVTVLIAVAFLGVILLRVPETLLPVGYSMAGALATFALVALVFWARRWRFEVAAWVLLVGFTVILGLTLAWMDYGPLTFLLILPVVIATLLISMPVGLGTAGLLSVVLIVRPDLFSGLDEGLWFITLIAIWATEGALLLTLNPLLKTVEWAWFGYESSREALEQARDYQQRLHETLEDLTETNAQLQRLNRMAQGLRQEAENERRIKEQFVANVSHELRTPLNMIVGFCEMIMEMPEAYGAALPPNLLADLDVVFRNSQHLSGLVDDVLDLSQIEAGQMALVREHVVFHDIVESAVTSVRPLYQSKQLYLDIDIPEALPSVFCDHIRIREVMLNLLSNAGRFTERGGVKVTCRVEDARLVVSVADTGPGIAKAQQARLFRPFEQLDGTIRRRYGGTGLGLSISRSFVELHEGTMWVESQEGKGTTFFFSLPLTASAPLDEPFMRWIDPHNPYEARHRPLRLPKIDVKPRWIVVERGNALHRLLSRHLEGLDLVAVPTLEAAVATMTETPSQALLINSLDVVQGLRELQSGSALPYDIPTIVCSVPGIEQAVNGLGVADYLVKPISREKLLSALENVGSSVKTVLIVDDEREAQILFRRMLSSSGRDYQVLRARNGRQAIEVLEQHQPDVILLDLTMPDMDGFEFLRVSKDRTWRDTPVILISARDPLGHPIVSNAVAVTATHGLSANQLLTSIKVFTAMLSSGVEDASNSASGPGTPAVEPDPQVPHTETPD